MVLFKDNLAETCTEIRIQHWKI